MSDQSPENEQVPEDNNPNEDDLEDSIEKIPDIILKDIPEEHKESVERAVLRFASLAHVEEKFEGPIPPPRILRGYENIASGSANRIIAMAEKEQEHRHSIETKIINAGSRREELGLWFGFVLAMTLGLGSIYLISIGRPIEGFIAIIADITTLVGVFVLAQREKRSEHSEAQDQPKQLERPTANRSEHD